MDAVVEAIFTAPAEGLPMVARDAAEARPGIGLDGDRYAHGTGFWSGNEKVSRDLTLVEAETVEALETELGSTIGPGALRRNVVTRGIRLNDLVGRRFRIGNVVAEGTSLCEPCAHLEATVGRPILRPLVHRAGLRANVLTIGRVSVGDPITLDVPGIGVGVVVRRGRRYLLGLRLGARGDRTWSTPGGSVAPAESVLACAVRELREETGLVGERARVIAQSADRLEDGLEWRSVFVAVDVPGEDEPELREPGKCAEWAWFEPTNLPRPLFAPVASVLA